MIMLWFAFMLVVVNLFIGIYMADFLFVIVFLSLTIFMLLWIFESSLKKIMKINQEKMKEIISKFKVEIDKDTVFVNKNTGNRYVLEDIIINKTNNLNNEYILYHKLTDRTKKYCRCKKDFEENFFYEND